MENFRLSQTPKWLLFGPRPHCQTIVLYTWLLPCEDCKNELITKLGPLTQDKKVLLVYTSRMEDVDDDEEEQIVEELQSAGMEVKREEYDHLLHPISPEPLQH